jgi:hypothetical protein
MTAMTRVARSARRQRVLRIGAAFHNLALTGAQAVIAATT